MGMEIDKGKLFDLIKKYSDKDNDHKKSLDILANESELTINYKSEPKKLVPELKQPGEKALQRAILFSNESFLQPNKETIEWLDMEVPMATNKNGKRESIDLLGKVNDRDELVLAELKFKDIANKPDSPLSGIFQLVVYYYLLTKNYKNLDTHHVFHKQVSKDFKWKNYVEQNKIRLLFVANESYFDYWKGKGIETKNLQALLQDLSNHFGLKCEIYMTGDVDFKKQQEEQQQKNGSTSYEPKILNKQWTRLNNEKQ